MRTVFNVWGELIQINRQVNGLTTELSNRLARRSTDRLAARVDTRVSGLIGTEALCVETRTSSWS